MDTGEQLVASTNIYSMRDLNQRTADVIREINDSGRPAAITRHGRFVAVIIPVAGKGVEAAVLSAVLESAENSRQLIGDDYSLERPHSVAEVSAEIDVRVPSGNERPLD